MDDSDVVTFKPREDDDNMACGGDAISNDQADMIKMMIELKGEISELKRQMRNERENSEEKSDELRESERSTERNDESCNERDVNAFAQEETTPTNHVQNRHVSFHDLPREPPMFPIYSTPIRNMQVPISVGGGNVPSQSNSQIMHNKVKPQKYDGSEDFGDYLTQFNLLSELNGWNQVTKSLNLAGALSGNARALLTELSEDERRNFESLVGIHENRFGSKNRAEVFRSKLQGKLKGKDESIPELAQSIRKLTRKAYPTASNDTINVLAIENFIEALPDTDIRLRLKEVGPKTIMETESIAVRLEAHRIADKNRGRQSVKSADVESSTVKSVDVESKSENVTLKELSEAISVLTKEVKNIQKPTEGQKRDVQNANRHNTYQNVNDRRYDQHRNFSQGVNGTRPPWSVGQPQYNNRGRGHSFQTQYQNQNNKGRAQGHKYSNMRRNDRQKNDQGSNLGAAARRQ